LQNYNIFATQPSFYCADFYLLSPESLYTNDWDKDRIILKNSAPKKPSTLNPSTSFAHKAIIAALITKRNNPKVKTVKGKVNKTNMGFTKTFSNPKTIATIIAEFKPSTCAMLGKK
jgi:hypothetical protein